MTSQAGLCVDYRQGYNRSAGRGDTWSDTSRRSASFSEADSQSWTMCGTASAKNGPNRVPAERASAPAACHASGQVPKSGQAYGCKW